MSATPSAAATAVFAAADMKTLTSTTTATYANDDSPLAAVKCAELYRIGATGEYRFRCCLCTAGEFGSTGDILAHVQHDHPDGSLAGGGALADPLSPSSSPSSGVCLTMLSSSSLRLGQKRCGSSDDEDGLEAEDQDEQSVGAVIRQTAGYGVSVYMRDMKKFLGQLVQVLLKMGIKY